MGRILPELMGAVGQILMLAGSPTVLTATMEVLLVLTGLDLVFTGVIGQCPLPPKLGHLSALLRRT